MIYGTSHFVSMWHAGRYYAAYGWNMPDVEYKLAQGQIHIGKPALKPGEVLTVIDGGARYAITDKATIEREISADLQRRYDAVHNRKGN